MRDTKIPILRTSYAKNTNEPLIRVGLAVPFQTVQKGDAYDIVLQIHAFAHNQLWQQIPIYNRYLTRESF